MSKKHDNSKFDPQYTFFIFGRKEKNPCRWCLRAEEFLLSLDPVTKDDIKFFDVSDPEIKKFLIKRLPKADTIPQIFFYRTIEATEPQHIGGYDNLEFYINDDWGGGLPDFVVKRLKAVRALKTKTEPLIPDAEQPPPTPEFDPNVRRPAIGGRQGFWELPLPDQEVRVVNHQWALNAFADAPRVQINEDREILNRRVAAQMLNQAVVDDL